MRYILMHATDARWERGEVPSRELVTRVGRLIGEMARAGVLLAGEGLRATATGARLKFSRGNRTIVPGPYAGSNELVDGFVIIKVAGIDRAIDWGWRLAELKQDAEIDVRPVTEPWDIGLGQKPAALETQRYMLLRKADAASESGRRTPAQRRAFQQLIGEMADAGVLVASESLAPSARGRRYKFSDGRRSVIDGPFTESKELIAGYVLLNAASVDDAAAWVPRYQDTVESPAVELRQVEEFEPASA